MSDTGAPTSRRRAARSLQRKSKVLPSVVIVIVTWNHVGDTLECLQSLGHLDYANYSAVLVDNGSTDDTVAQVRAQFPDAQIIENRKNLGYAAGNNVGLDYALAEDVDYIWVLNNDTVVGPSCLLHLVGDLEENRQAAAASPKVYFYGEPTRVYFAGGAILWDGRVKHLGYGEQDAPEYDLAGQTEWLPGCAMLFRASTLRRVGLFEPRYFLVFEDVDWSARARRAGYALRFVPDAKLWHKLSPSFGKNFSPMYQYYHTRNGLLWIERNFRLPRKLRMLKFALTHAFDTPTFHRTDLPPHERAALQRAVRKGIADYFLRRFGAQYIAA
jgi:GT2 family glycosyltransferase